jgi:hypothetical protein
MKKYPLIAAVLSLSVLVGLGLLLRSEQRPEKVNPSLSAEDWSQKIRSNPAEALEAAPSRTAWESLPADQRAVTPEPVEGMAELVVEITGCDVDHPHQHAPKLERVAVLEGRVFKAHPAEDEDWKETREKVWIQGVALNGELAMSTRRSAR